jgi:3-phosphoshikimate 1-carboxyvinyltransferase
LAGFIPGGGSPEQPLELFVANAGTTARFLAAMVCLGKGVYRLHGTPRMHARPQAALFQALRQLGYRVESPNERLPVIVHGGGRRPGKCRVSVAESSQFASALLLAARTGGWEIEVVGENAEEAPYVAMTVGFARRFATAQGNLLIEPDASSGSYFWAAGWLAPASCLPLLASQQLPAGLQDFLADPQWSAPTGARPKRLREWVPALCRQLALRSPAPADAGQSLRQFKSTCSLVGVADWPDSGWQVDEAFADYLPLPPELSRQKHLGDSILTAAVLAPLASGPTRFTDLGRLRLQECERVTALRTELSKCGAQVLEDGDTLQVFPGPLHGAEIETYNDHRLAMCFTILGLKVPGIKIKNPACVSKTFPDFFQKLAAAPPHGLGAEVREAQTGRRLGLAELFAEQSQSLLGPAAASSWGNESASRHCD